MRVGTIVTLLAEKKFGFIRTDHFRDDVFFHQSTLKGLQFRHLEVGMEVEFEINEILRLDEQKLEATLVQQASRPLSKSLDERPMREMMAAHHPRARQKKPTWREPKPGDDTATNGDSAEDAMGTPTSEADRIADQIAESPLGTPSTPELSSQDPSNDSTHP
jgi:cold shock CspA family protein